MKLEPEGLARFEAQPKSHFIHLSFLHDTRNSAGADSSKGDYDQRKEKFQTPKCHMLK